MTSFSIRCNARLDVGTQQIDHGAVVPSIIFHVDRFFFQTPKRLLCQNHNFRPRSYSREREEYYARHHHRERERERDYRGERDRYYRERSRSPRSRDRERAEREKYYEVRFVCPFVNI